ncbi:MAG TPA: protein-disulfide reductase DsbD domain-containing protein, partial [Vicinamibacteria bacterium]
MNVKAATLLVLFLAAPAHAASVGKSRQVEIALLSEAEWVRPGHPFRVGIHMKIAPGWHTYWKNPGDAGLPLRLAWTLPEGFSAGPIQWPVPDRIPVPPLMSYGYSDEVLFPVEITPPASGAHSGSEVTLAVKADWLECKEACLPAKAVLDLTLPLKEEDP